jgi:hypothetical protein
VDRRGPTVAEQLTAILSALLMVWVMMPPQERLWIRLRTVAGLHRFAGRLARVEGLAGMGDELAGRRELAWSRYGGALVAGRVRDRLAVMLERMKP